MSAFDTLPDAIVRLDADRRITEANAAAARLAGRPATELKGKSLADVFAPRTRDGSPVLVDEWHPSARLRSVVGIPENEVIISADGTDLKVRVTGRYERTGDGSVTGAVLCIRPPRRSAGDEPTGARSCRRSATSSAARSPR